MLAVDNIDREFRKANRRARPETRWNISVLLGNGQGVIISDHPLWTPIGSLSGEDDPLYHDCFDNFLMRKELAPMSQRTLVVACAGVDRTPYRIQRWFEHCGVSPAMVIAPVVINGVRAGLAPAWTMGGLFPETLVPDPEHNAAVHAIFADPQQAEALHRYHTTLAPTQLTAQPQREPSVVRSNYDKAIAHHQPTPVTCYPSDSDVTGYATLSQDTSGMLANRDAQDRRLRDAILTKFSQRWGKKVGDTVGYDTGTLSALDFFFSFDHWDIAPDAPVRSQVAEICRAALIADGIERGHDAGR